MILDMWISHNLSKIIIHHFNWWFIWTQHIDQLPVGLLVQLVEHCTGIAEIMGSYPARAWIFFRSYFQLLVQ